MTSYMAIDQYGQTFHGLKHPRKELVELVGCKHVSKMYVDRKDGSYFHAGYVVGRQWFRLYRVEPFCGK